MERGWWNECDAGICFNDSEPRSDTSLRVHHFRTSNIKEELSQLDLFWKKCLENTDLIPAQKVKYPEGQSYRVLHINNIKSLDIEIMEEGENLNNPNYSLNYFGGEKNIIPQFKKQCEPVCQSDDLEDNDAYEVAIDNIELDEDEDNCDLVSINPINIIEEGREVCKENDTFKTKAGFYLNSVLPEHKEIVNSFDNNKFKLKTHGISFRKAYEIDLAKIEVLLSNKYEELQSKIHEIEMKNIEKDGSLKIIEIEEAEYRIIMDKMTTISALRSNMNI